MITKMQVGLNGVLLHSLDDSIIIQGVDEQAPNMNPNVVNRAGLIGQRFMTMEKRYRDVVISFAIKKQGTLAARRAIYDKVCAWASAGGKLTLNYRPGMELRVVCTALPALANVSQWGNPMTMTFRAYNIPQWISTVADQTTVSTASAISQLTVTGNAGGKLRVAAVNNSGSACASVTLSAHGKQIKLNSLGLANGETLILDYTDDDIQRIRIKNANDEYRSVLAKRTVDSVDDIWLTAGENDVRTVASVALDWTLTCFGRWE